LKFGLANWNFVNIMQNIVSLYPVVSASVLWQFP